VKNPLHETKVFTSVLHESILSKGELFDLPVLAWLHFDMGKTYANEGQYDLAIDAFKSALREHPDFLGARLGIKECYQLMDEYPPSGIYQT